MTGVPSIVFGLFIYIVLVLTGFGGSFAGWKGSIALALLMLPVVTRSAEVVLNLVPNSLREAALALGAPRWRVVFRIVLPTALPGPGHRLAAGGRARGAGETAPLLFTAFAVNATTWNLGQQMNSLPIQIFNDVRQAQANIVERAWGAALTLVAMILILTLVARAIQRRSRLRMSTERTGGRRTRADGALPSASADARAAPTGREPARSRHREREASPARTVTLEEPARLLRRHARGARASTLTYAANEVTAMIGPSGCGKSTLVRCINRMHEEIPGARAEGRVAARRRTTSTRRASTSSPCGASIGMVFQKPNPFPTMSIFDNVAAGLRLTGTARRASSERVEQSLRGAGLWDEVKDRLGKPGIGLSGGQQQRLCIARTIAVEPEVIMMDEPCSALDPIATLQDRGARSTSSRSATRSSSSPTTCSRPRAWPTRPRSCSPASWSSSRRPTRSSRTPTTRARRSTSPGKFG